MEAVERLPASKLGTKEHWDEAYERELSNFASSNNEDIGEVWFGEGAEEDMVDWLVERHSPPEEQTFTLLDIGTGNASLLLALHRGGFTAATLGGIDYSPASIALATAVRNSAEIDAAAMPLQVCDFLNEDVPGGQVDVAMDKGTFDACCLALSDEEEESDPRLVYPRRVAASLKEDGVFLITSCNWTKEELVRMFTASGELAYEDEIKRPTFSFGGQKGQTITSVSFRKVKSG